nr:uncharacterized protein LOC113830479 [Penaeus vannamei]
MRYRLPESEAKSVRLCRRVCGWLAMKPALGSRFFFLICVLTCSAHNGAEESLCPKGTICARGLILPIDEEPRPVAVWTEKGDGVRVDGPGIFKDVRQRSEAKWLNFTAVQRGEYFLLHH